MALEDSQSCKENESQSRRNQDDILTFILCVCREGERVWRYDQAPQFAQEHSKHSHCKALVLRMIQEVDRTVKSSSRYLEPTCYQPHVWMKQLLSRNDTLLKKSFNKLAHFKFIRYFGCDVLPSGPPLASIHVSILKSTRLETCLRQKNPSQFSTSINPGKVH